MLFLHIVFGLAIYPIACFLYYFQDKLTFYKTKGFIHDIFMNPVIYWGFKVVVVLLWIYFRFNFANSINLKPEISYYDEDSFGTATNQLITIYLLIWIIGVITLGVKAFLYAEGKSWGFIPGKEF